MEHEKSGFTISTPVAVIVAGVIIAGAVVWSLAPRTGAPAQGGVPAQKVDVKDVKTAGSPFIGSANAKVTIAYWFDYQCPFCKQSEEQTLSQIRTDYVATGKVKVVFMDFAFLGPDSTAAALAARAVFEVAPEKFDAWHSAMFSKQDGENSGWGSKADIAALTSSVLGASDSAKVTALLTEKAAAYQSAIDADKAEGTKIGVTGTPGFLIGEHLIVGAQPYAQVKQTIEDALKGK